MSVADFGALFVHFLLLSVLSIGGAIATAPEMHRYLVTERGWLGNEQFSASVALAQAAPGPNLLFVAVLGWNIAGALGVLLAMLGILLPSTTLAIAASRCGARAPRDDCPCAPSSPAWRRSPSACCSPPAGCLPSRSSTMRSTAPAHSC